jgi:hypothetical protein
MYFQLSEALCNRFIVELRRFWALHPKYQELVENIQGKYSFEERPQYGIIVKPGGISGVHLSADNFVGTVISHISLQKIGQYPGMAVEWAIEDATAIQNNGGVFPTLPGIYFIDIQETSPGATSFVFYVDVLLDVRGEIVTMTTPTEGVLLSGAFHSGTLRLWEAPAGFFLREGDDYTADPNTGVITLTSAPPTNSFLVADYRYPGTTTGPHELPINGANNTAIPGVVLAFGNRVQHNDKVVLAVDNRRSPTALEYGGRWEMSMDIDIIARDVHACREIADRSLIHLWGQARPDFSTHGIELMEMSGGGEAEEIYDETGDDYFYNASLSLSVQTDWSIRVPLVGQLRNVVTYDTSVPLDQTTYNIKIAEGFEMRPFTDPYFVGRNPNFEVVC